MTNHNLFVMMVMVVMALPIVVAGIALIVSFLRKKRHDRSRMYTR